jgi:CubicO group peptidase (beta-lactamase class C family)
VKKTNFPRARTLLRDGARARAFPAAVLEIGNRKGTEYRGAFGALHYGVDAAATTSLTIFDLASLTKVISTTTLAMCLIETGSLQLNDPVYRWIPGWRTSDRKSVTVKDLLEHTSGLSAYLPFYRNLSGRAEFEYAISSLPLEYAPRSCAVYSDLGFIVLGFILENAGEGTLETQFSQFFQPLPEAIGFRPSKSWLSHSAPTEIDLWRGRLLAGEVHDENAWALGGVAGHAGLFGTAGAVGRFAQSVLQTLAGQQKLVQPSTLARFIIPSDVLGSSRALGWDTMRVTSSCGTKMTASAIGHTGFTGTSVWIDPNLDLYVVLLSNRIHPNRTNEAMAKLRPLVHDAIVEAW